ncbi:MAG: RHS repeat protein, partial [Pseudoalteromonas sp.]|nr:RHS repeat protein [Pseudoalteromonas sp.]
SDPGDTWEFFDPAIPDWANDLRLMRPGRGYWVLTTEAVTLEIRNQGPPPTVAIASPADLAVITEPTDILGTATSDRLDSWTLTSRAIGDGDGVTLATGNAPITDGKLATFDPTLLLNGLYELELTATDFNGQQVTESIAVAVEGQMKIGHFTLSFVDLAIPVSGLDIEIIRTYDSRDKQPRDFGVGWSLDIRQGSYRNNRKPGEGWELQNGFQPCDTVLESKSHLTVVRLSDQEVYRFALRLFSGTSTGGGCFATARFDYIDGPLPGTTLEILGNDQVFYENASDRVIDTESFELYEPEDVRLTTRDGRIFELDLNDGVTLVEDLNGNRLSITAAGITHSSGKGIEFERDAEGRIERIVDPMNRVNGYTYDTAGDLASFTDRAGAVTRFNYDDHRLMDIEDPRGVKPIRNEYDAEGRLVRHVDAFGKVIELGHDRNNRREVVTNRLGASRVLEYDARGNVVRETDELG